MHHVQRSTKQRFVTGSLLVPAAMLVIAGTLSGDPQNFIPSGTPFPIWGGASQTYSTVAGGIDETGPFFQSLGTNGRSCASCHQPSDRMSVSNVDVSLRFAQTQGLDPIFRTVDGSNCNHVLSQQDEIDLFNFLSAL